MKRLKKWHLLTLTILIALLYVFIQNKWIFIEKGIPIENYKNYLIGTEWINEDGSRWVFNKENILFIIDDSFPEYKDKYTWSIKNSRFEVFKDSEREVLHIRSGIQYMTENHMQIWIDGRVENKINFNRDEI